MSNLNFQKLKSYLRTNLHTNNHYLLVSGVVLITVIARLLPHIPNFTPVLAVALFLGTFSKNKNIAMLIPISILFISDLFIGFYSTLPFVYASVIGVTLLGSMNKSKSNASNVINVLVSSLIFFIVTNLGVWLVDGLYTLDFNGLMNCFTMAIPFYKNELFSNIIFSSTLFGGKVILDNYSKQVSLQ